MIGRESDLADLRGVLAESLLGNQRCVVVAGEAGIGKTRLLQEFQTGTRGQALALVGQCVDLGNVGAPYAPIMGVLRDLVAEMGREAVDQAAGPGRAALSVLIPELREVVPIEPAQDTGLNHLHEVVAVLLESFSRQTPLLVVIEDLHWADGATLNLLRFLLKVVTRGRIMFVLSYRSDDVPRGHPLRGFLSELERNRRIVRWELRRLTRAQVLQQTKAILGNVPDTDAFESVFERSDGVPFFVEELLGIDDCEDGGALPETLRELLLARYERLSQPTQHLLRLTSAGGVRVEHDLLAAVFEGDADALDRGAREAVFANVLVPDEDSYTFRHALVREAIQADLLPGERTRFHARFAEALEALPSDRLVATEVSYHWTAAHNVGKAFPASLMAMAEAKKAYAYSTASLMGERALELWEQVPHADEVAGRTKIDVMGQTASALRNAGESERSLAMVNHALAECPREDGYRYARLLRDKASHLAMSGSLGSIELLQEALDLVPEGSPGDLRSTILTGLAARYMIEARLDDAIAVGEAGLDEARRAGSARYSSVAANMIGISRIDLGQIEAGLAQLDRARDLAEGDGSALLRYRVNYSDILHLLGRYREAVTVAERGLLRARELGVERSSGVILASNAVDPLFALGEWDRADTLIDRGIELDPPLAFAVYMHRARLRSVLWRGDPEGAAHQLRAVRSMMTNLAEVEMQTRLGTAHMAGEIALACGDLDRAWAEVSVLMSPVFRPLPGYDLPLAALAARVLAARRTAARRAAARRAAAGDVAGTATDTGTATDFDIAERQLRDVLVHDSFWPSYPLWSALFEAELGGTGGTGSDVAAWQQAMDLIRLTSSPAQLLPYAGLRLGLAQIEAGDRAAALENLQAASVRAAELGAGLVIDEVARVAARAGLVLDGGAVLHRRTGDSAELTARERQVLELIGEGLSNRQIGERLFISAKTASVHVSAILRKLGASSRTEAVFLARSLRSQ